MLITPMFQKWNKANLLEEVDKYLVKQGKLLLDKTFYGVGCGPNLKNCAYVTLMKDALLSGCSCCEQSIETSITKLINNYG